VADGTHVGNSFERLKGLVDQVLVEMKRDHFFCRQGTSREDAGVTVEVLGFGQFVIEQATLGIKEWPHARLTRNGDPEPIHLEETDTSFAIESKGHYHIDGPAFVYSDRDMRRITTVIGYITSKIAQAG
jgi:hypothetical protein